MYTLIQRFLFLFPAEFSHHFGLKGLKVLNWLGLASFLAPEEKGEVTEVFGLQFKNSVGLAAGLDKNADYIDALGALGFGFLEVGTVTPKAQSGNAKPRLFRLTKDHALINRMGFNNKGVEHMIQRLKNRRYQGIIGVNIGKNFSTPLEQAYEDYLFCLRELYAYADYIVVNLSSPNTPGLRALQFGEELNKLLNILKNEQHVLSLKHERHVPLLLKIAPDLNAKECQDIAQALLENNMDGVVATNTTISRQGLNETVLVNEAGGLSGEPLAAQSESIVKILRNHLHGTIPIIGVGGITDQASAQAKLKAGASLLQIYTGFIYKGPKLIGEALKAKQET
ncbi:MAG: quinone-dependent dihydroorotate dehydrogenase [Gammaproteobacteria bacterium]|nr:quinone-dependent dihydroorotate dehydrogenase [Gammaproteobacteria bacterium]